MKDALFPQPHKNLTIPKSCIHMFTMFPHFLKSLPWEEMKWNASGRDTHDQLFLVPNNTHPFLPVGL